jgi:hypothetical protein
VTALLEPWDQVAGDAYDYAVNAGDAFFAVFDGADHDLQAGIRRPAGARRAVGQGAHEPATDAARGAGMPSDRLGAPRVQLELGDRLLLYSDGIVEARNADGEFFGEHRLVDFTQRAELAGLPAPETLRRLTAAVLAHQSGRLQDDATLVLVDWSADAAGVCSPPCPDRPFSAAGGSPAAKSCRGGFKGGNPGIRSPAGRVTDRHRTRTACPVGERFERCIDVPPRP